MRADAQGAGEALTTIFIDGDACPVKEESYRVAQRYGLDVKLVSNTWMRLREAPWLELVLVGGGLDAADDWIAEHAGPGDIVITDDIPLAARCVGRGAHVLSPKGRVFTEASMGGTLADRNLLSELREQGQVTGGPAPFQKADRSRFLQSLDQLARTGAGK